MLDLRIIKPARFSIQEEQRKGRKMKNIKVNGKNVKLGRKERRGLKAILENIKKYGVDPHTYLITWDGEMLTIPCGHYSLIEEFHGEDGRPLYDYSLEDVKMVSSGTGRCVLSFFRNYRKEGDATHSYVTDLSALFQD